MKRTWLIIFLLVMAAHVVAIYFMHEVLQTFTKPLIIPVLAAYFFSQVNRIASTLKKWIYAALFFSWAGDVLLMFQSENEQFFLLGLGSFLLAHIFYILFFVRVKKNEGLKWNAWVLLPVVFYYGVLITILFPYLGDMKIAVLVYGLVISAMFFLAIHMLFIRNKMAGNLLMNGALLFVVSDSILAINKFYQPFKAADILIMVTYGLAQLLIVSGASHYITQKTSRS